MPWAAAAAVAGAAITSSASGKASKAQTAAANQADATQRYQYDQTREDQAPFRDTGVAANSKLAYLLGIGGSKNPTSGAPSSLANAALTSGTSYNADLYANNPAYRAAWDDVAGQHYASYGKSYNGDSDMGWVENALRSRLQGDISADQARLEAEQAANANDPQYGSLLKKFDQNDLNSDVVYNSGLKFGLDQGTGAINQRALQSGSYDSGGTLKALTQYANDYGSTKANEAYNRYNTTNDSIYNKLAGISGTGQTATNQVQAAGQNYANNVASNQLDAGNARAAGIVGGANAWNDAATSIGNTYNNNQQNEQLKKLLSGGSGSTVSGDQYGYFS